jgi:tRNA threonylcarbamoyladenosine biosynthesis protein TsaE
MMQIVLVQNETEMLNFAGQFALICKPPLVIYLKGQLGAGKTTFTRGFLRGLGWVDKVKSPTYTLVESYSFDHLEVFHFDFYRILDPEELEWIGIRDYFHDRSLCLIEWPEQGGNRLPKPDIIIQLTIVQEVRRLELSASTQIGKSVLKNWN